MRKHRAVFLGVIMTAGAAVGGAAIASGSEAGDPPGSDTRSFTPEAVAEMKAQDQPLPVADPERGDSSGGTFRQSELDESNDRVDELLAKIGIGGDDPRWDEAARAAMVIEAVAVKNDEGEVVGYLATRFIPVQHFDDMRRDAQNTLDRLAKE